MFVVKDGKVGPARVKVSASPVYTLNEIKALARDYLDNAEGNLGTENVRARLELSLFVEWLARKEKEAR